MSRRLGRLADIAFFLRSVWGLGLLATRSLQPLLALAVVVLVGWALLSRQPWPFAVDAQSERALLQLAGDVETSWRIDGAQLCVRAGVELPLPPLQDGSPCPSRRWRAYELRGIPEVALRLPPAAQAGPGYSARLDVHPSGALAVQLDPPNDDARARLFAAAGQPLLVADELLLHFPVADMEVPYRRLLLPFVGTGSIGNDVAWHDASLLRSGTVYLYTHSDEAAGGRDLVAEAELLPGDRVDLGQDGGGLVKGFVRYDLAPRESAEPAVFRVVAFGEADAVSIVRFGDQGYSFSPGLMARLSRHSAVATWAVLLLSVLGFMAVYREGSEIGFGSYGEVREQVRARWRKLRGRA